MLQADLDTLTAVRDEGELRKTALGYIPTGQFGSVLMLGVTWSRSTRQ